MKKWLLLFIIFLAIGIGCLYFFIPTRIYINENLDIPVNAKGFSRVFANENNWHRWWPGEVIQNSSVQSNTRFRFNGNTYTILGKRLTSIVMTIHFNGDSMLTELLFIPRNLDSIALSWRATKGTSYNPAERLQRFYKIKGVQKDLKTILQRLQKFYTDEQHVYGVPIKQERVLDSNLVSTMTTTKGYPSVENIYGLIEKLNAFVQNQGAQATGLPMLNVNTSDSSNYLVKVALPVNKKVNNVGEITYRRMLGGGNILVTEVRGGPASIDKAFIEMTNYVEDHQRSAPAIPFQSLITDRRTEPDTSKWVTKVYWPVM